MTAKNTCLYCGLPMATLGAFHACCRILIRTVMKSENSGQWELLKVLDDRGDVGIADSFAPLDKWELNGIIKRHADNPNYRALTEQGKRLVVYLCAKRNERGWD